MWQDLHVDGLDLDATALAEAVWLAATLPAGISLHPEAEEPGPVPPRASGGQGRQPERGQAGTGSLHPDAAIHEQLSDSPAELPGESVAVARGRALPNALHLLRALRAYKRPWVNGLHAELDIEQTVDGYARSGELIPAFRAAPERWFDLLLIVDRSLSMQVWKETINELERVLDHLGAFRLLRTWGLTFENAQPVLHDHQGAVAGPDHVLSPQGRRLVIVVSDCSTPGWYSPEVWRHLRTWARSTPVALLDLLPPKLWRSSALDLPAVTATQAVPGSGSTTLRFDMPVLLEHLVDGRAPWLPVPVLSLSSHSLGRWARAQMRGDPGGCDAILIPPAGRVPRGEAAQAPFAQADTVKAFVRTASPTAVKLAVLCALVGRVGLPVLQLIQHELVPEATVADIAELITSDIVSLHPQEGGIFVVTFRGGAEEELKQLLSQHEAWRLCVVLEEYVGARVQGAGSVPAVLHNPNALELLPAEVRPFGHAAQNVLRALGAGSGDPAPVGMASIVASATARIAGELDVAAILDALFDTAVADFADSLVLYLRDPLPIGDERPTGPLMLRRWHGNRSGENSEFVDISPALNLSHPGNQGIAEVCEVRPGSVLAEVLRGVRPVFTNSRSGDVMPELFGEGSAFTVPDGRRVIFAPLRGRRRVIGAALFLRRPERMAFEADDLLIAAQLATHSAIGIDKAVLYGREAYLADELQRTMLPERLPRSTGVRLASRYLPAAETARVGGDWYDAIPLPGSRVALVVGDVMGHSMTSSAIMGQLRTTTQTLAGLDLPPQEVLHQLDEQAQRLGTDRMATCLYAVYDPVSHRITIANAGHPPPVLLHLGGYAEVLRVPSGAPIGIGGVDFEAVELDAPAGATLLLYTDGLVESRLRDVWTGIEQLRERIATTARLTGPDHPPPLEALCDEVLDMLGPGDRDDDIALLAARFDGIAPSDVAYWLLEPEDGSPARARRLVRRVLARWGLEQLSDAVELLVSEVVTNAVRYASRPIALRLLHTDVLRCEVSDDVPHMPRLRRPRVTDEGGRGLYLVNNLARRWGSTRLGSGKMVWFECSLPGTSQTAPDRAGSVLSGWNR
ncbi:SAV_2336 N-terminal domain-related protein [Streptomyces sp. NPDC047853]|uniref:SAV_2336 N-terminal domain-related protein n=1 Tax=Streptomyces sp. NPDC047853 TaxID=3365489 RepID=UPI003711B0AA